MAKALKFCITPEYLVDLPPEACRWKLYHLEHLNAALSLRRQYNLPSIGKDFLPDWDDFVLGNSVINKKMCNELEACRENEEIVKDLTKEIFLRNSIENLKGDFYYKYEEPKKNFQEIKIHDYSTNQTPILIAPKADMLCFHKDYIWMVVECKKTFGDADAQLILGMVAAATYNLKRFDTAAVDIVGLKVVGDRWFFYETNVTQKYINWLACQKTLSSQNFKLEVEKYPYEGFYLKQAIDRGRVTSLLEYFKKKYGQQIRELNPKKHGIKKYFPSINLKQEHQEDSDVETSAKISRLDS